MDCDCVLESVTELAIAGKASGNDSMLCLKEPEDEEDDIPVRAVQNFFTNATWHRSLMSLSARRAFARSEASGEGLQSLVEVSAGLASCHR
jgi:hypothetical protein